MSRRKYVSCWQTLKCFIRLRRIAIICYHRSRCLFSASAVTGTGTLSVGKYWLGQLPEPSTFTVLPGGHVRLNGNFVLHKHCNVRIGKDGSLTLGSGYAADNLRMDCHCSIVIGDGVAIASDVTIMDTDHHKIVGSDSAPRPISIGDHVWIGTRSTILKGVTIGNGAVIAAGSVVNRDVEPGWLYGGVPARKIRPIEWHL